MSKLIKIISDSSSPSTKSIQAAEITCCHPNALKVIVVSIVAFYKSYIICCNILKTRKFVRNTASHQIKNLNIFLSQGLLVA